MAEHLFLVLGLLWEMLSQRWNYPLEKLGQKIGKLTKPLERFFETAQLKTNRRLIFREQLMTNFIDEQ